MYNDMLLCLDSGSANVLGILDTTLAPALLYYAYIPAAFVALLIGLFVYFKREEGFDLPHKLLLAISIVFFFYISNEILQWITVPASLVHFEWQMIAVYFTVISLLIAYFTFAVTKQRDVSRRSKILLGSLALPVLLLLPSKLNMVAFDISNCESVPGLLFYIYSYGLPFFLSIILILSCVKEYLSTKKESVLFITFGAVAFLFFLSGSDFLSELVGNHEINLFGPIGMLVFLSILAYMIVRFGIFNVKLFAAQVFVVVLVILVASELLFTVSLTNRILVSITLALVLASGLLLIRSVKKEIAARERNEELAKDLAHANSRLRELDRQKSEFVSIASHQLRSPLTSIRGYASMLKEGSYGVLSKKALDIVDRIQESGRYMALSIEDFLNISRIEQGRMKYECASVKIPEMLEKIVDELRSIALKKGIVLYYRSQCEGTCVAYVDPGKMRQIVYNLIDNALKYTKQGSINVSVSNDLRARKIKITIQDTGIGMSEDTISKLFDKFMRAKNANSINVTGTGLGLYVARQMAEAMQGKITAVSEGEGLGSSFIIDLPLAE